MRLSKRSDLKTTGVSCTKCKFKNVFEKRCELFVLPYTECGTEVIFRASDVQQIFPTYNSNLFLLINA